MLVDHGTKVGALLPRHGNSAFARGDREDRAASGGAAVGEQVRARRTRRLRCSAAPPGVDRGLSALRARAARRRSRH
eukprot:3868280-Prymnesium_polylepis.1